MSQLAASGQLNWLLDDLVARVDDVRQAVVLSRDGLMVGTSEGMSRADADHLSAVAAGFHSLARGASDTFGGGQVRQTIVEMELAFLFVVVAGSGTCLAVLTEEDANIGLIAYEMTMLVKRVHRQLGTSPRFAAEDSAT
jgi:predicted regulator of Ras-like GTPase activity (Roadblock/LC7/MglB family)